jgi:hypothetical protein
MCAGPWSPEEVSKLQQVVERALALKNTMGGPRTIKSVPNRDMAREKSMFVSGGRRGSVGHSMHFGLCRPLKLCIPMCNCGSCTWLCRQ